MAESILGLDIGSSKISAVVCELPQSHELVIRGLGRAATAGLSNTGILDEDLLAQSVMRAVQRAVREAGVKPGRVVVGLPTWSMRFVVNSGVLSLQHPSGMVQQEDVNNCLKRAMQVVRGADDMMVHGGGIAIFLDGAPMEDPVGKAGRQLEITARLIFASERMVDTITHIVKQLGFHVSGLSYDQFGAGTACLSDAERQYGALLIDVGALWTRASVFQKSTLYVGSILSVGGNRVTEDIAHCLKVSMPDAEHFKLRYGHVLPAGIADGETIPGLRGNGEAKPIRRRILAEIMRARMQETLVLIKKRFRQVDLSGFPVILAGGGSNIPGLGVLASEVFEAPVRVGIHPQFQNTIRNTDDHVAVGEVLYGMKTGAIQIATQKQDRSWWQKLLG